MVVSHSTSVIPIGQYQDERVEQPNFRTYRELLNNMLSSAILNQSRASPAFEHSCVVFTLQMTQWNRCRGFRLIAYFV